ncbi:MAG: 30S ribosomal protein S5 [Candidatus Omnitrophota bacterium]|nr:30S ribosomal protein S5 [Candidatus Omnitrophota bacterium]
MSETSTLNKQNQGEFKTRAFIEKVLSINRVTKVTKGGKNMGFSALVVVGDGESIVGHALGKANEVSEAIKKGIKKAKKSLVVVNKKETTIPHQVYGKFGAVEILLKPAAKGTGVIACSSIRAICECVGIKDILTKILKKSTNPINVVKATFEALGNLKKK